jgi:hypothetical protein
MFFVGPKIGTRNIMALFEIVSGKFTELPQTKWAESFESFQETPDGKLLLSFETAGKVILVDIDSGQTQEADYASASKKWIPAEEIGTHLWSHKVIPQAGGGLLTVMWKPWGYTGTGSHPVHFFSSAGEHAQINLPEGIFNVYAGKTGRVFIVSQPDPDSSVLNIIERTGKGFVSKEIPLGRQSDDSKANGVQFFENQNGAPAFFIRGDDQVFVYEVNKKKVSKFSLPTKVLRQYTAIHQKRDGGFLLAYPGDDVGQITLTELPSGASRTLTIPGMTAGWLEELRFWDTPTHGLMLTAVGAYAGSHQLCLFGIDHNVEWKFAHAMNGSRYFLGMIEKADRTLLGFLNGGNAPPRAIQLFGSVPDSN